MIANRDFVRFLWWNTAVVMLGALLAMALVLVADPYRIYRLIDVEGFNHVKPAPTRYQEEIKLSGARALRANAFILGNSRAEIGLNPDYSGFSSAGYSAYNLAISGTRASTARREIDWLREAGDKPSMVVLGVEFIDFLRGSAASRQQPASKKSVRAADELKWKFDTLFSLASVTDAIDTLQIQRQSEVETITPRGFNPLLEYKKYAREEGYYALFQQRAMENVKSYMTKSTSLMTTANGGSADTEELRKILSENAGNRIELNLVIYPYHAQMLAIFDQMGLWPAFEQWKQVLVKEIADVKKMYPDARITLWDFSGFSDLQCEVIPAKGDRKSVTQWYWEAGHFKPALGDMMLARMLEKERGLSTQRPFGFALTPLNLEENRNRIAQEKMSCIAAYPALFSDVAEIIRRARH